MLGNDKAGNCVFCTQAHLLQAMQRGVGISETKFTAASVTSDYSQVTGYSPSNPVSDQGTLMRDGASFWRQNGILDADGKRHTIVAYVDVRIDDPDELMQACFDFGGVALGVQMPESAMTQFKRGQPWTVPIKKKILGGHAVALVGRNQHGDGVIATWDNIQAASRNFLREFADECVAFISLEYLDERGVNPRGYDRKELERRLAALG